MTCGDETMLFDSIKRSHPEIYVHNPSKISQASSSVYVATF
jgi:hypothetical protein